MLTLGFLLMRNPAPLPPLGSVLVGCWQKTEHRPQLAVARLHVSSAL